MDDLQRVDILLYSDDACEAAHYNVTSRAYHVCAGIPEGGKGQCNVSTFFILPLYSFHALYIY